MTSRTIEASGDAGLLGVIERLIFLETVLQFSQTKRLERFSLAKGKDQIIAVQLAGAHIARHLGLEDLTFLIEIKKQSTNVAGRIHLNDDDDIVTVEIDESMFGFQSAILATLCHELTHKFLSRNRIELADRLANEKLTDTAAVFLGMGSFMIEGSFSEKTTYVSSRRRTESLRIGYLTTEEFSLAMALLQQADRSNKRVLSGDYVEGCLKLANGELKLRSMLLDGHDVHSTLMSRAERILEKHQCNDLRMRYFFDVSSGIDVSAFKKERSARHRELRKIQHALNELSLESNTRLVYLKSCKILYNLSLARMDYSKRTRIKYLGWQLLHWRLRGVAQIECPACDQALRTENLGLSRRVRCPKCAYKFLAVS